MNFGALLLIVVAGVIVADLVSHVAGTQTLFSGLKTLWGIGINPTDTASIKTIKTTPVANK